MQFDLSKRYCYYFNEICKIPHGSRNEKAISDFIVNFAKEHHLEYKQDDVYNVIIEKKASAGYEDSEPIILQAHIDMVNEKNKTSNHDFDKDPLDLYVDENGWLHAKGTTLGADDGKGVAYMLAILEDDSLSHPALQCFFTSMEEIGLLGAVNLKAEDVKANKMINLDGGGEFVTTTSSAGGANVFVTKEVHFEANTDATYRLEVRGLLGGHSGTLIHTEKGNANIIGARVLKELEIAGDDVTLVSFNGGLKDNAIPREADVVFTSTTPFETLQKDASKSIAGIAKELEFSDAGFNAQLVQVETSDKKFAKEDSENCLNYAFLTPNGFQHKSMAIEGLTQSSTNLGVITTDDHSVLFDHLIRSSIDASTFDLLHKMETLAKLFGMTVEANTNIKAWSFEANSPMRELYRKILKDRGLELKEVAIHGGLETGVFKGLNPKLDIITMGAISEGAHTPDEKLDLASFDRTYTILCEFLKESK